MDSSYVTALREALRRGVKVTLILDRAKQEQKAALLAGLLEGARAAT